MIKYDFNKLIRNKLPARMKEEGVIVHSEKLDKEQYVRKLKLKLLEEAQEVTEATGKESIIKELADVLEVIHALALELGSNIDAVESERLVKCEANGYFEPGNYVHYIEVPKDNKTVIDYLAGKDRPYVAG
jgi:predicted house-cleaning noncanonical NTP pyrophosphatase (MazG superfamily)